MYSERVKPSSRVGPPSPPRRPVWRRLRLPHLALFLLTFALVLFGPASPARSAEKSYTIPQVQIQATVLPDGSMQITDSRTWDFDGSFSWVEQWIPLPAGSQMQEIRVQEGDSSRPAATYAADASGQPGTFEVFQENGQVKLRLHIQVTNAKRTFVISYRVTNAVTVHADVAELYWQFIGNQWKVGTGKAKVMLQLPPGAAREEIRAWGHGPLHGNVAIESGQIVSWSVDGLPSKTFLEGRVTFPTTLVPGGSRKSGKTALPAILKEETANADRANAERARVKAVAAWDNRLALILGIGGPLALIWFLRRYGRGPKGSFDGPYYRELPGDYTPAELGVLWRGAQAAGGPELSATLLDLARRGVVRLDSVEGPAGWFGRRNKDLQVTYVGPAGPSATDPSSTSTDLPAPTLTAHEQRLLDFLFAWVGGGSATVALSAIQSYARQNPQGAIAFRQNWQADLQKAGREHGFWSEQAGKAQLIALAAGVPAVILGILLLAAFHMTKTGWVLTILGGLFVVASGLLRFRTQRGADDYSKWKAFRRFLTDFSRLDLAEVPAVTLWEHYLVYATVLGVAKACLAQMKAVLPNLPAEEQDRWRQQGTLIYGTAMGSDLLDQFDAVGEAFGSSFSQILHSQESSGSGHGGGFSSGGGGGGGGGGGDAG